MHTSDWASRRRRRGVVLVLGVPIAVTPTVGRAAEAANGAMGSSSFVAAFDFWFTPVVVGALAVALAAAFVVLWLGWSQGRRLGRIAKALRELAERGGKEGVSADAVRACLEDDASLVEPWAEFEEGLVSVGGELLNAHPAEDFFKEDELLARIGWWVLRFRMARVLPSVMTGLGMLGTFAGIAAGLSDVQGLEGGDTSELFAHVGEVVVGLSSAFWTSIFGLAFALLTTLVGNGVEESIHGGLTEFREAVDRLFPRATAERLLAEQGAELRALRHTEEEASSALAAMANDIADGITDRLNSTLSPALGQIVDSVKQHVEQAAQVSSAQAEAFTAKMVESLIGAVEASADKVNESLLRFAESFDGMVAGTREVARAGQEMAATLDRATERMAARHEAEEKLLDDFRSTAQLQEESLQKSLQVLERQQAMSESIERERREARAVAESFRKTGADIEVSAKRMVDLSDRSAKSLMSAAERFSSVTRAAGEWAETTTGAVNEFGQGLSTALGRTLGQYDKSLAGAVTSLGSALGELEEVVDQISSLRSRRDRAGS